MKLSERVKACRAAAGWSQVELAARARVSQQLIGKLETGDVLETRKLPQLAAAFRMTLDELLSDSEPPLMPKAFGKLIREKRKAQGMTQLQLADRIGVTKAAVSHWEKGRVEGIDPTNLHWLSQVLFLTDADLKLFAARPKLEFAELPPFPQSEMEVIHKYAALPENVRRHIRGIIEALSTNHGDRREQEAGERGSEAAFGCKRACVPDHRRFDGREDHAEGSQGASGEAGPGSRQGGEADRDSSGDSEAQEKKNRQVASETLSANVRALIERVGSGAELARLTGVPQKTISRIANGENAANLDTLNDLAHGLRLEPWRLLAPDGIKEANRVSTVQIMREVEDTLIVTGLHKDTGVLGRVGNCLDDIERALPGGAQP